MHMSAFGGKADNDGPSTAPDIADTISCLFRRTSAISPL